ncbi:hypothetical protein GH714_006951 [Hevea brasiliensis]|uniref:Thioredoxin domain-containing protein n=1 Tax=Hevea brasiliensis TaxID=3981 RepID=A0A6A6LCI3_HEVBR|nr:hypothetical protein GH714_006951 [Hevea brasiliensis]
MDYKGAFAKKRLRWSVASSPALVLDFCSGIMPNWFSFCSCRDLVGLPFSVLLQSPISIAASNTFFAMATITNFLSKPPSSLLTTPKINPLCFHGSFLVPFASKHKPLATKVLNTNRTHFTIKATAAQGTKKPARDERVQQIHSKEDFDEALKKAKSRLVVVEYAASHSTHSSKIYPFMVQLSRTCNDVDFLLVMGDESEKTRELCKREKVEKVPHFSFYKGMEKIHEEGGISPDQLMGDVLYYGDNHSEVLQLHCREDVEKLIDDHKADHKLIVLDVGIKHCGPCVKVYPTVLKLSRKSG